MKLLPPAVNTLTPPMAVFGTDPQVLQLWDQAQAQEDALNQTANLKTNYLRTTFGNWLASYSIGRLPFDAAPPQPPNGYMVLVADDGITCDLEQIGPPVCDVPAYTKMPPPQTPAQAGQMLATLGANLFTKATPLMTRVPAPDGSVWVRVG